MIIRKNISLNEQYLKKLEPLLQKHNGNLSAVIRDVIDLADAVFQDPDSVKRMISGLKKERNLTSHVLNWALSNLSGRLPDEDLVESIIGDVSSITSLERRLNELGSEIYWCTSVKISSDDSIYPRKATFTITGKNQNMNRFLASIIAIFVSKKFNLGIVQLKNKENAFEMSMKRGEDEWVTNSIEENFGHMNHVFLELHKKPDFWSNIVKLYSKMNYSMVALPKQFYDDIQEVILPSKLNACIESFFDASSSQQPQEERLKKIRYILISMGLIEHMEINRDSLIITHGFSNPKTIETLKNTIIELLQFDGQTYHSKVSGNLIILKKQSPVAKIIISMLENLETKEISFPDFNTYLMKMLELVKKVSSEDELIKLGCECGKLMIRIYEKEKKVSRWDERRFIEYAQEASAVLLQDAEWELISENVIHGKIITCPLARNNNDFNIINCRFIKGIYNGWVSHVFGEKITQNVHTEGERNNFCEIYVL